MTKAPLIFVTGTDTDVGKTFISALLVQKWKANYWKPIQTGLDEDQGDTASMQELCSRSEHVPIYFPPRHIFQKPLSPLEAMNYEPEHEVLISDFSSPDEDMTTPLVAEGAGGVYVPLTKKLEVTSHLIKHLVEVSSRPVKIVVVARSGLGTLNHTLLTLEHLSRFNLDEHILGCILNGEKNAGNVEMLKRYGVKIIAEVQNCVSDDDYVACLREIPDLAALV